MVTPTATPSLVREMHASIAPLWRCDSRCHAPLEVPTAHCSSATSCQHQTSEGSSESAYLSLSSLSAHYNNTTFSSLSCSGFIPGSCSSGWAFGLTRGSASFCSSTSPYPAPTTTQPGPHKRHSASLGLIIVTRWSGTRLLRPHQFFGSTMPSTQHCSRSIHASAMQADSVLRKRRTKMKRHKWKKRQRLMRRKSKVSQGAKR